MRAYQTCVKLLVGRMAYYTGDYRNVNYGDFEGSLWNTEPGVEMGKITIFLLYHGGTINSYGVGGTYSKI
jgi:hypothetical protein